tara:strand:+ start:2596 stop:3540 length:945 start_codon:yes stop_codon:yes gene_type:complete
MAFLDNSGDIILDAVLTDAGRERLARGDGSFRIVKFALGDDEINYQLYNKNHANGSAYFDLEILQTPVLEAFTNNTSGMKSKLMTIPRNNLLYLPVMRMHNGLHNTKLSAVNGNINMHIVAVDNNTETTLTNNNVAGVINGATLGGTGYWVRIDQGLDTEEIAQTYTLDADLVETQYIIQMDSRLGSLVSKDGTPTPVSFIDDDQIATYYLTNADGNYVNKMSWEGAQADQRDPEKAVRGPLGTKLEFAIKSSIDLQTGTFLFTKFGTDRTGAADLVQEIASSNGYFIDSVIKVIGGTTGYSMDVPVRFVKLIS